MWMRVQVLLRDGDRVEVVREPARPGATPDGGCLQVHIGQVVVSGRPDVVMRALCEALARCQALPPGGGEELRSSLLTSAP